MSSFHLKPIKVSLPKGIVIGDNLEVTIAPDTKVSDIASQMAKQLNVNEKNWNLLFIRSPQKQPVQVEIAKSNDVIVKVFPEVTTSNGRLYFRPSVELR